MVEKARFYFQTNRVLLNLWFTHVEIFSTHDQTRSLSYNRFEQTGDLRGHPSTVRSICLQPTITSKSSTSAKLQFPREKHSPEILFQNPSYLGRFPHVCGIDKEINKGVRIVWIFVQGFLQNRFDVVVFSLT